MLRRLLDRNIAALIGVALIGELLICGLAISLVLKPQTDRIAETIATMVVTVSRAMDGMPASQRSALLAGLNTGHGLSVTSVRPDLTDRLSLPTFPEHAFTRALARALDRAGLAGQPSLRWNSDRDGRHWLELRLGGASYWMNISATGRRAMGMAALWLAISMVAAIGAGILLQRLLDVPLRRLVQALDAYGANETRVPLDETGPDEVAAAARALNRMTARLAEQDAERALMLAGVSHDLRTPLTRLRLSLAMMHGEEADLLESAGRQIDRIEAMLAQFLDFSRSFDTEALVETNLAVLLARVVADTAGEIALCVPDDLVAQVRPGALTRAVENLLANARIHGTAPIGVTAAIEGDATIVAVSDGGPGFPEEDTRYLCRPFARGDAARGGEGTGLGLAIVERIAEAHDGRIRFDRTPGSFSVGLILPRTPAEKTMMPAKRRCLLV